MTNPHRVVVTLVTMTRTGEHAYTVAIDDEIQSFIEVELVEDKCGGWFELHYKNRTADQQPITDADTRERALAQGKMVLTRQQCQLLQIPAPF